MPELPEVQTVVNDLQMLTGDTIVGFWTDFKKAVKSKGFEKEVVGRKIRSVERLGKNIIITLDSKKSIVLHLKMTGKLLLNFQFPISLPTGQAGNFQSNPNSKIFKQNIRAFTKINPHIHHLFSLKKHGVLAFSDMRKFATLEIVSPEKLAEIAKSKGVDPFSKDFTVKKFTEILASKQNKNIKSILMNQSLISGIGNIYASEISFDAKLSPLRKAGDLAKNEITKLHNSILKILTQAIKLRGTSISDYRDAKGEKGGFQNKLKVYGKAGKKCQSCDTMIEKVIVEQRSTFYCPTCQK
jgi:formamidopyrimidine-DNA glycosylase